MKKQIFGFCAALLAFSVLLVSCTKQAGTPGTTASESTVSSDLYGKVNDETITKEEMAYFSDRLKAEVMNDYLEKYSVTYSDGFWTEAFDSSTPQKTLDSDAFKQCLKAKVELIECKKLGIYDDISFAGLKKKAESYNSSHETASGSVGLKSIDMTQFYTYYVENGVLELKDKLSSTTLKPTTAEIAAQKKKLSASAQKKLTSAALEAAAKQAALDQKFEDYILQQQEKVSITVY